MNWQIADGGGQAPHCRSGKLQISKKQGNEAKPLTASLSGSELLPTGPPSPARQCYNPPAPSWPPRDDSSDISSLDPSPRPNASVHPLPPHLTLGANRPLRGLWTCFTPHSEGSPTLPGCWAQTPGIIEQEPIELPRADTILYPLL